MHWISSSTGQGEFTTPNHNNSSLLFSILYNSICWFNISSIFFSDKYLIGELNVKFPIPFKVLLKDRLDN